MKKFISMIIILLLIIMTMISYTSAASNTYSVNMYLEDTQYKQGDTIYIPVKLEDIDIEQGVVAFNTIIEYDKEVFETVKFQKADQWQTPTLVEDLIHSTTDSMQPSKEDQEIMTLVLKVKSYAKLGETQIELSEFEVSDTENTIENAGAAVSVEIIEGDNIQNTVQQVQNEKPKANIQVPLIIGVTTTLIIILLIVYYVDKKKNK